MNPETSHGIELDTRVRQSTRIATRTLEGQALVVQLDRQQLHTLNAVGTLVFELADGRTLGSIVDAVVARFDVTPELARADVQQFAAELIALGALEPVD